MNSSAIPRRAWIMVGLLIAMTVFAAPGLRNPSLAEVLAQEPWQTGTVTVRGEAENVREWPTASGTTTGLNLDWSYWNSIGALPQQVPAIFQGGTGGTLITDCGGDLPTMALTNPVVDGERVDVQLNFETFDFDGIEAVWARELNCPFPMLNMAMNSVIDDVSRVVGFELIWRETRDGWATYEVLGQNGSTLPLDGMSAHLLGRNREPGCTPASFAYGVGSNKQSYCVERLASVQDWVVQGAIDFVVLSDVGGSFNRSELKESETPVVASLAPLADSQAAKMAFLDNGDGRFGDMDEFRLYLGDVNPRALHSFILLVVRPDGELAGIKSIVGDSSGPFEWPALWQFKPRFQAVESTETTLRIKVLPAYDGSSMPLSDLKLRIGDSGNHLQLGANQVGTRQVTVIGDETLDGGEQIIISGSRDGVRWIQLEDSAENRILWQYP